MSSPSNMKTPSAEQQQRMTNTAGATLPSAAVLVPGLLALLVGLSACSQPGNPPASPSATPAPSNNSTSGSTTSSKPEVPLQPVAPGQLYLNQAQPKLQTIKVYLGSSELETEIARTRTEIATGMMYRESMGENEAMLFVFNAPHQVAFYMRNTKVPLSCAYIDPDGNILEIHDLKPLDETSVQATSARIQYVLEVPQGWFDRHKVGIGSVLRTDRGTLRDTFFR